MGSGSIGETRQLERSTNRNDQKNLIKCQFCHKNTHVPFHTRYSQHPWYWCRPIRIDEYSNANGLQEFYDDVSKHRSWFDMHVACRDTTVHGDFETSIFDIEEHISIAWLVDDRFWESVGMYLYDRISTQCNPPQFYQLNTIHGNPQQSSASATVKNGIEFARGVRLAAKSVLGTPITSNITIACVILPCFIVYCDTHYRDNTPSIPPQITP